MNEGKVEEEEHAHYELEDFIDGKEKENNRVERSTVNATNVPEKIEEYALHELDYPILGKVKENESITTSKVNATNVHEKPEIKVKRKMIETNSSRNDSIVVGEGWY